MLIAPPNPAYRPTRRRGFNLIEAAIVLGVIGIIVGGIWVAASAVRDTKAVNDISSEIISISDKLRSLVGCNEPSNAGPWHGFAITAGLVRKDWTGTGQIVFPIASTAQNGTYNVLTVWLNNSDPFPYSGKTTADSNALFFVLNFTLSNDRRAMATQMLRKIFTMGQRTHTLYSVSCTPSIGGPDANNIGFYFENNKPDLICPDGLTSGGPAGISIQARFFACESR